MSEMVNAVQEPESGASAETVGRDHGISKATLEQLKTYILNSYQVMMSRGIKGCYVFVCNENLRKYLSAYIPQESQR